MGNVLSEIGLRYAMLKELKEHHETCAKAIGSELAMLGVTLFQEFASNDAAEYRLIGERAFTDHRDRIIRPIVKYKGTVVQQPIFYELLKSTGQQSLIKTAVAAGTLNKWIEEHKKKNKPLPDDKILKVWNVETIKVTRAPRSASEKEVEEPETQGEE
jgi:hypothetical protein